LLNRLRADGDPYLPAECLDRLVRDFAGRAIVRDRDERRRGNYSARENPHKYSRWMGRREPVGESVGAAPT
jgi:hypothetical protein